MHRDRADQQHNKKNRQSVNWERKRQGIDTKQGKAVSEVRQRVRSSEKPGIAKTAGYGEFADWIKKCSCLC